VFGNLAQPALQLIDGVFTGSPVEAHLPAVDPPAGLAQRLAQRHGGAVVGDETGDDQGRWAILGTARAEPAEGVPNARAEPSRFMKAPPVGRRRVVTLPSQRCSPPINSCNALGKRTRPSAV